MKRHKRTKILSYGGGLNSFAMWLRAVQRGELPDVVIFMDVTDPEGKWPGEWPGTYQHMRDYMIPMCEKLGVEFVWLDTKSYPIRKGGADECDEGLFAYWWTRNQIPVASARRNCTIIAKVERFEHWMNDRFPGEDVEVWIGFEAGEEDRVAKDPNAIGSGAEKKAVRKGGKRKYENPARRHNRFPLIEEGLCRCAQEKLVAEAGYPVPRKSACVFCPYGSKGDWQTFAKELPEQFAMAVELEAKKTVTTKGKKLSIMGYQTIVNDEKRGDEPPVEGVHYKAPPLSEYVKDGKRAYKRQQKPCEVCGAPVKATKATACDYLAEDEMAPATQQVIPVNSLVRAKAA